MKDALLDCGGLAGSGSLVTFPGPPHHIGNERISSGNSSSVAVSFFCVTVLYILNLPSKPDLTTEVPSALGEGSPCKDVKAKAVRRGW